MSRIELHALAFQNNVVEGLYINLTKKTMRFTMYFYLSSSSLSLPIFLLVRFVHDGGSVCWWLFIFHILFLYSFIFGGGG